MRKLIATMILIASLLFLGGSLSGQDEAKHGYVGVDNCGMCHKGEAKGKQLEIWKNSPHAKAYFALKSAVADSLAQKAGFTTPAAETEACLKCHVAGYNTDKALLGPKFKMEDGVQCETCHGPGSDYKAISVMKNRETAIAKGLIIYDNPKDLCVKCHNPESPTYKEFNFEEAWANKISHPIPKK